MRLIITFKRLRCGSLLKSSSETEVCFANRSSTLNAEIFEILQKQVESELKPRSFRLNSSKIALNHPLILRGIEMGLAHYGSPTLSDQALMPFDTLKIGPGDSARSHTADEFIYVNEIEEGIKTYIDLLENLNLAS